MAIKTFTSGEILTASDTNTFLANSGMVYITQQTLSGSATNIEGCFTSAFRDYRIVLDNLFLGGNTDFCWQGLIGGAAQTGSDYWVAALGFSSGGATYNQNNSNVNPGRTGASSVGTDRQFSLTIDIFRPQLPNVTTFNSHFCQFQTDDFRFRTGSAGYTQANQLTGIRFLSAGGQSISGNATVYGYRIP
jgi:hypothetical protein